MAKGQVIAIGKATQLSRFGQVDIEYRYGADFIMNGRLVKVRTEYLPQLHKWIRENLKSIQSYYGNYGSHTDLAQFDNDYFKPMSVCYAYGIPKFFGQYRKEDCEFMKHPEA